MPAIKVPADALPKKAYVPTAPKVVLVLMVVPETVIPLPPV